MLLLVVALAGCASNRTANKLKQDSQQIQNFDNSLTFQEVTLEEFDRKGQLWWRVKAKQAVYDKDKKNARVESPTGEFFQDGKSILQVKAKSGEVKQDGKSIFLRGDITATETREGLLLKGDELEWQPENDLLIVRNNLSGTHKDLKISGKEGRYYSRKRTMDLMGQVVAVTTSPQVQLNADKLTWMVQKQMITTDRPLQISRLQDKNVTERATANKGSFDLKAKVATLQQNAQVTLTKPALQLVGNALTWNLDKQTLVSTQPLTVNNPSQQVTIAANQGNLDLKTNVATMTGNVRGSSARNGAQLNSNSVVWNLVTQQFQAEGNVNYRQANPPLNLTGPRASGGLSDQTVVVSGGRVQTEVIP